MSQFRARKPCVNRTPDPLNAAKSLPTVTPVKGFSLTWQQTGSCRNGMAADFYPPMHTERKHERLARERRAKSLCAACPVQTECLEHVSLIIRDKNPVGVGVLEGHGHQVGTLLNDK